MKVRSLIASDPNWLTRLVEEFKIHVTRDGDLASLKYNQIESPMHEPIVQECRGMVVDVERRRVLAHPYNKFWNYGETLAAPIDWATARVQDKLDGSLMILYFDAHRDVWCVASSGQPTAGGPFGDTEQTFAEAFWSTFRALDMRLPDNTEHCFMFEFCAAPNRIIVRHDSPRIVLHGSRHMPTGREWSTYELSETCRSLNWEQVAEFPLTTIEDCLHAAESLNPIAAEGFVVVDAAFNRIKIKSPRYVMLHHMKGEATPRRAIELWQTGETAEVLAHFPEFAPKILPTQERLDRIAARAIEGIAWASGAATRKDFALAVKEQPWSSIAFKLYGKPATVDDAREVMRSQSMAALERMLEAAP